MRKVLAVLIMLLIGSIYVLSIKQDGQGVDNHMTQESSENVKRLVELEEILETKYPNTPKEVIEIHNELMQRQYSKQVDEAMLKEIVKLVRELYASELLGLNTYEAQLEGIFQEVDANKEQDIFLESSTIETIEFIDQQLTIVEVKHHITQKTIERMYYLVKEEDKWKIRSWKDESVATE